MDLPKGMPGSAGLDIISSARKRNGYCDALVGKKEGPGLTALYNRSPSTFNSRLAGCAFQAFEPREPYCFNQIKAFLGTERPEILIAISEAVFSDGFQGLESSLAQVDQKLGPMRIRFVCQLEQS